MRIDSELLLDSPDSHPFVFHSLYLIATAKVKQQSNSFRKKKVEEEDKGEVQMKEILD